MSIAIDRADITSANRSGDVVTITTRRSLRDANGERDTFRFRLSQPADLMTWYEARTAVAAGPSAVATTGSSAVLASYQALHDHRIGGCQGTLILTADRVAFESLDEIDDSRQWQLADIKEVEQRAWTAANSAG